MIRNKMEMSTVIKTLNEVENLKLLLFDKHQYQIFDFIPKPFLIDGSSVVNEADHDEETEVCQDEKPKLKTQTTKDTNNNKIIFSEQNFWKKSDSYEQRIAKFSEAISVIKKRNEGKEKNPIDMRLLEIMGQLKNDDG